MGHFFSQDPLVLMEATGVFRLTIAALLGSLMGLERSISGKHAGMRTYALVAMGSCLFVVSGTLASYQLSFFSGINPLQIAGSVVLGIGFIGSGLAALRSDRPVELTTAAGIWVVAGIGMAAGFGFTLLAFGATILATAIFTLFHSIEIAVQRRYGHLQEEKID